MKSILRIAGKELGDVTRERSILVALMVQFLIAAFSGFLLIGLTGLYDPGSLSDAPRADLAYVGPGGFDELLDEAPNLRVQAMELDAAMAAFADGRIAAVVQERTGPDDARSITLLLPDGELQATLLTSQLRGLLEDYEDELRRDRQDRLDVQIIEYPAPFAVERPYLFGYTVLLPLLVLTPVFLAGAITGDSFQTELQTRTLALLRAAPVSAASILAGKLFVPVFLAPAQVLLWVALFGLNGLPVPDLWLLLGTTLLMALLLAGVGLLVALFVRREHQSQEAYALTVLALAGASLWLPRDPLNLIARIATGSHGASDYATLVILAGLAVWVAVVGGWLARRRMEG
jgi:ABC-2 type transport system permease protein